MRSTHVYDPTFLNSSGALKQVLSNGHGIHFDRCLDMPCGNGRNIFLLTTYFKNTVGVDINDKYLDEINRMVPNYHLAPASISTKKIDLINELPEDIHLFDFISIIHYYDHTLITRVIKKIRNGAFLFVETPGCAGGNYRGLPFEEEVNDLFKDLETLMFKSRPCASPELPHKIISFKTLVRKSL